MWFWWFMFVSDMLIPVTFIICGKVMQRQASEKINGMTGYHTKCSMRNAETWKFANEHCGRLWWRIGWCMLPLSALVHLPFIHSSTGTIGTMGGILCAIQTLALIVSIIPTEAALRKTFTENGERIG